MTLKSTTEMTEVESAAVDQTFTVAHAAPTGVGRRRLLRAGLAATPVILAVSGRSAMAATACPTRGLSPLAWHSLTMGGTQPIPTNCSHTITPGQGGWSPGGWKPQVSANKIEPSWPATCVPYDGYAPGNGCNSSTNFSTGTKFNEIFTSSIYTSYKTESFSNILLNRNGSFEFHLCAAYLNAMTVSGYSLTVAEVLNLALGKIGTVPISNVEVIKEFIKQTYHA